LWKLDVQRLQSSGLRRTQMPLLQINWSSLRRRPAESFSESLSERKTVGIPELPVDHDCILLSIDYWQPQFEIWQDPALDPPRIEEHGQSSIVRIPEILRYKKCQWIGLPVFIDQVNPLP